MEKVPHCKGETRPTLLSGGQSRLWQVRAPTEDKKRQINHRNHLL